MRMICLDRPDIGLSSIEHDRKLSDYPKDVSRLAKHLDLLQYHALGHCGGSPYATACAYASSKGEIPIASVLPGLGPLATFTTRDDTLRIGTLMIVTKWISSLLGHVVKYVLTDEHGLEKALANMKSMFVADEHKSIMSEPENKAMVIASMQASYGPLALARTSETSRFTASGISSWTRSKSRSDFSGALRTKGPADRWAPLQIQIPDSELVEYEGMTHFNLEKYAGISSDGFWGLEELE